MQSLCNAHYFFPKGNYINLTQTNLFKQNQGTFLLTGKIATDMNYVADFVKQSHRDPMFKKYSSEPSSISIS